MTTQQANGGKCEHRQGDECGCICHTNGIRHYGCCLKCPYCHRLIPGEIGRTVRVMRTVTGATRSTEGLIAPSGRRSLQRAITSHQVDMLMAIAGQRGVGTTELAFLEWLEYESGLGIQVKRIELLRMDDMNAIKGRLDVWKS